MLELNVGHRKVLLPRFPDAMSRREACALKDRMLDAAEHATSPDWRDALLSVAAGAYQLEKLWDRTKTRQPTSRPSPD